MNRADFGGGLPRGLAVKQLRLKPEYRSLSEPDCSERRAACHQRCSDFRQSRSPGGTCRWPSARRSPFSRCRATPCKRSDAASVGPPRRSPVNCDATRRPERRIGVSCDDCPVACRPIGMSAQTDQTCAQHNLAHLCGGATCRHRRGTERRSRSRPGRSVERPPAWPAKGSAMGQGLEPGADCPTLADRLPGRQDDAHQPRSHLSGSLRSRPGSATPRTVGLLANGTRAASAQSARKKARQGLCLAGDHDQSTPRRSSRSSSAGTLGGRPHPWSWQLSDWYAGRAYDAVHDAAASSPPCGAWRSSAHEERPCARGTRS